MLEINCSSANTSYQSTIELINEARSPEYPLTTLDLDKPELSKTGYPAEQVYDELFDDLNEAADNINDTKQSRERVLLASEDLNEYDVGFYRELLVRAAASVLSPLGWREKRIEQELGQYTESSLASFG